MRRFETGSESQASPLLSRGFLLEIKLFSGSLVLFIV